MVKAVNDFSRITVPKGAGMIITEKRYEGFQQWSSSDETLPKSDRKLLDFRSWYGRPTPFREQYPEERIICVLQGSMEVEIECLKLRRFFCRAGEQFIVPAHSRAAFLGSKGCYTAHFPIRSGVKTIEVVTSGKPNNFAKWLFRGFGLGTKECAIIAWEEGGQSDPHDHSDAELQGVYKGRLRQHYYDNGIPCTALHLAGHVTEIPAGREHIVEADVKSISMMYYFNGPVAMNILPDFALVKAV